jgi:hypothetical protein
MFLSMLLYKQIFIKNIYFFIFNQFIISDLHRALLPASLLINCINLLFSGMILTCAK